MKQDINKAYIPKKEIPSFNAMIQKSIIDNWDRDALTDFKGQTLQYHDVARKIEKLHILFEHSGVVKGDKIALCGRNSSQWAVAFLATLTYGAIALLAGYPNHSRLVGRIMRDAPDGQLPCHRVVSATGRLAPHFPTQASLLASEGGRKVVPLGQSLLEDIPLVSINRYREPPKEAPYAELSPLK